MSDVVRTDLIFNASGNTSSFIKDTGKDMDDLVQKAQAVAKSLEATLGTFSEIKSQASSSEKPTTANLKPFGELVKGLRHSTLGLASAGSSGNPISVGTNLMDDLAGMGKKLGPAGLLLMAAAGATSGISALSDQYEKVIPAGMTMAAQFGEVAGDPAKNSLAFTSALERASRAASEFGYSLEEGTGVLTAFSREGLSRSQAMSGASQVFAYSRAYGLDPEDAAQFVGTGVRYGNQGNLLGLAAGGLSASGMGRGQFKEFTDATLSIFEEGLEKGIVKGFKGITETQAFFSQAGDAWKGRSGAEKIAGLNSRIEDATNLSSETSVLIYRAARDRVGNNGDYIDAMKQMEGGVSVGLFKAIMDQIKLVTGKDRYGLTELVRSTFGVNYTGAEKLIDLDKTGAVTTGKIQEIQAESTESNEQKMLRTQEEIRKSVREIGSWALGPKMAVMDGIKGILEGIATTLGVKTEGLKDFSEWGIPGSLTLQRHTADVTNGMTSDQRKQYAEFLKGFSRFGALGEILSSVEFEGGSLDWKVASMIKSGTWTKERQKQVQDLQDSFSKPGSASIGHNFEWSGYSEDSSAHAAMEKAGLTKKMSLLEELYLLHNTGKSPNLLYDKLGYSGFWGPVSSPDSGALNQTVIELLTQIRDQGQSPLVLPGTTYSPVGSHR